MLNVKVHDSIVRKRQNKYGLFRRVARRTFIFSKKNMAAWLLFAKPHLNKPQSFWNIVLWRDNTKVENKYSIISTNTAYQLPNTAVKR